MSFKALKFLKELNIPYTTEHHHAQPGWIGIKKCPFCGAENYHLGIHETSGAVNCWKCGGHALLDTIEKLCNVTYGPAKQILGHYGDISARVPPHKPLQTPTNMPGVCSLPPGTKPMVQAHRDYLRGRNFDPELIERLWNVQGVEMMPGSWFSMRLIIPITYRNIVVSYQGRDITGKRGRLRYKTCAKSLETRFHKHCLYGLDVVPGNSVVITEGVTKVWRLGPGAVATFGIIWTMVQASLLLNMDRVFILYDKGPQAQDRARALADLISGQTKHTEVVELTDYDDPADLPQEDATALMKELRIISRR